MKKNKTKQNRTTETELTNKLYIFKSNSQNTPCTAQGKVYIEIEFPVFDERLLG